jgi:hypothetical protein
MYRYLFLYDCRWGQAPQQHHLQQQSFFYSRTFSLPAVDGRLPEILFSGGEHTEAEFVRGPPSNSTAAEERDLTAARTPVKQDAAGERKQLGVKLIAEAALPPRTGGGEMDGYKCPRCGKYFVSFDQVKEHQAVAHRDSANSTAAASRTFIFKYRKGGYRYNMHYKK